MLESLENKVFIVTGASKGFGFAIVEQLLAQGAQVGMIARGEKALLAAAEKLNAPNNIFTQAASVDNKEQLVSAVDAIAKHFGRLDGLVNNAGIARPSSIEEMTVEDINSQLSINIAGVIYGCQAAIPHLTENNSRIINISSASAFHMAEMAHLSLYAASKAAVERLSRDLRQELQPQGISVTVIRPGAAATDFANDFDGEKLMAGLKEWNNYGPYMDTGMDVSHVAEAVAWALQMPKGVAVDLLEIRPNSRVEKFKFD